MERFGKSYTFDIAEGADAVGSDSIPDGMSPEDFENEPEICVLEAIDAITNLLRSVFPEIEGHHLRLICDHPGDQCDGGDDPKESVDPDDKQGGIKL